MLGAGSYFPLCLIYNSLMTKQNTDNSVAYLKSGLKRGSTDSLVLDSVLSTVVVSSALCHRQFY